MTIAATLPAKPLVRPGTRIGSIDLLRGLIMIIMALDHVRDYFHAGALIFDPLDLEKTSVLLFFTRWITHFCAPIFAFLSGTSAYLSGQRKTKRELSSFLVKRGLFLVFLELTVVHFGWYFSFVPYELDLIVMWSLGVSMIALAALIYLPIRAILVIGIVLVAGHNLLDGVHVPGNSAEAVGWALLHDQRLFQFGNFNVLIGYPLLPWIGTMALGYCLGTLYTKDVDPARRKKTLIIMGCSAIALFIIIRLSNSYGDANHWSQQKSAMFTVLSFIDTVKYPPSLLYLLMTLGPAMLFLAFSEGKPGWLGRRIAVIGRVPLFFYIVHLYILHILALFATYFCGFSPRDMILNAWIQFDPNLKGYGFPLWVTYAVWIAVILIIYPMCRWYDNYKKNHREKWWLSYI